MIEYTRLNHITVNAPSGSQEKVRFFYSNVMGFNEIPIPEKLLKIYEILWFKCLEFIFHVEFIEDFEKKSLQYEEKGAILPGCHLALEVKNIKKVREHFEKHKVKIDEAVLLEDRERFYVSDPFGNVFEIIEFHTKK